MKIHELYLPGDLVKSRDKRNNLILWSSHPYSRHRDLGWDDTSYNDPDDTSYNNPQQVKFSDILIILKTKETTSDELKILQNSLSLSLKWKKGAYLVMSSNGIQGWVGCGWVVKI